MQVMVIEVLVKPNSKKGPLVTESPDGLVVYLREKPVDGAANSALVNLLAKHFKVAKTRIKIKTGSRGRKKLVEII